MMKKLVYGFFSLAVIAIACVIYSCSADGDGFSTPECRELMMPDEFKQVGIKHNEGLDAAFLVLRQHYQARTRVMGDDSTKLSKEAIVALLKNGLKEYYVDKGYDTSVVDGYFRRDIYADTRSFDINEYPVYKYVDKINDILDEGEMAPEQLLFKLNTLNREAEQCLSEEDAAIVYAGTSTCYYSFLYWRENYMKWKIALKRPDLLNRFDDEMLNAFVIRKGRLVPPTQTRGVWDSISETIDDVIDSVKDWYDESGKDLVKEDTKGAVSGAAGGAVAGSMAGGVGALPGAGVGAASGGISGSVAEIVDQAFE